MKKIRFTGKLSLNKETISKLNNEQLNQVNGGTGSGCTGSRYCATANTCPATNVCLTQDPTCTLVPLTETCMTTPEFAC